MKISSILKSPDCNNAYKKNSFKQTQKERCFKSSSFVDFSSVPLIYFTSNVNLKNKDMTISPDVFFIKMNSYKKDENWAKQMQKLTQGSAKAIKDGCSFYYVLNNVERGINQITPQMPFCDYFGLKRCSQNGSLWLNGEGRGTEYFARLYEKTLIPDFRPKSNEEYPDANTCSFEFCMEHVVVNYGYASDKQTNLRYVEKAWKQLSSLQKPTEQDVLKTCAITHWMIAQECPYLRGNDSIANVLTKALMLSYGINPPAYKEGVSADFEAFDTNLDDYIEKYPTFFEQLPKKSISNFG